MKILSFLLVLAAPATGLVAAETNANPPSAYVQAVKSYVDAATQEIRAIRDSVDAEVKATTDDQRKKRFDAIYKKLDRCDQLVADLKAADPSRFDKIKGEFEKSRADVTKALAATRSG